MITRELLKSEIDLLPEKALVSFHEWIINYMQTLKNSQEIEKESEKDLDKELTTLLDNLPSNTYELKFNQHGEIIIDENSPKSLVDWAVNG
jgi:hypothetical protein